ncbi:MAG: carbohydrate kinase [Treponema sp.]|jgi:sugar (pentulose or hexulose) kinase|nr:carbohydrate kinase [Treponema sp.]
MEYALAVIDIGMTNKKIVIFDETLSQIDMVSKTFPPVMLKHRGMELETHDLGGMKNWFFQELKRFAALYPIKAAAVSAHGATFVCVDGEGKVCAPCVYYTYEPGAEFQEEFYALAGNREELQRTTFTPPFSAMINPAKGIYFLQKYFPAEFGRTRTLLNLPQYWSFVLTGVAGIEPTYLGCHNYLWDHAAGDYSPVVDKLRIRELLPRNYKNSYESIGPLSAETAALTGLPPDTIAAMGIHDSNASLLPYLTGGGGKDFVLNSTGTWCVLMHPQEDLAFNPGDIGNIVFFNQSALAKPVKTAIFLGGMEFDQWTGIFKGINNTAQRPPLNFEAIRKFIAEKDTFLLPELVSGSGQFSRSKPGILEKGIFYTPEEIRNGNIPALLRQGERFYAALTLSLVIQTMTGAERAGLREGAALYIEGGFRRDRAYNTLLASALTKNKIFLTSMKEATASGAAMTALMACTGKGIEELNGYISIENEEIRAEDFPGLEAYRASWLKTANQDPFETPVLKEVP